MLFGQSRPWCWSWYWWAYPWPSPWTWWDRSWSRCRWGWPSSWRRTESCWSRTVSTTTPPSDLASQLPAFSSRLLNWHYKCTHKYSPSLWFVICQTSAYGAWSWRSLLMSFRFVLVFSTFLPFYYSTFCLFVLFLSSVYTDFNAVCRHLWRTN